MELLNKEGFDLWADQYDETVRVTEENADFPFAGYRQILNHIFNEVMKKRNSKVLDIGVGTGVLTKKLYDMGHAIDSIDFSPKMIAIAKEKMTGANLFEWDIKNRFPSQLLNNQYDSN